MSSHTFRTTLALGTGALAIATLAACGSSGGGSDTSANGSGSVPSSQASGAAQSGGQGAGSFQGRNPGTSGQIAAKQGSTLQVQNQTDGQVAVSYTAKTAITAQVAAALKDIKVGSCVTVTPAQASTGSTSGSTSSTLAAGRVSISSPVNGQCTGGFGGGSRPSGFPSGRPTDLPSGRPSGFPSGSAGAGRAGMMFANGKVTAVSGGGFTVANSFAARGGSSSGSGTGTTNGASTNVTVTVSGSTTYTTTKSSDASALKVGKCVLATGQTDSTGAVAASRLVVSDPVDGSCTSGFGFGGRGGQSGASGASGAQGGAA